MGKNRTYMKVLLDSVVEGLPIIYEAMDWILRKTHTHTQMRTHTHPSPPPQTGGKEHRMNPHEIHIRPTRLLRIFYQQKHC
jgi:hypothetical protein